MNYSKLISPRWWRQGMGGRYSGTPDHRLPFPGCRAWAFGGLPLGERDLLAILREHDGEELILKPADGVYGAGIRTFKVIGESLLDRDEPLTVAALMESLAARRRYILQGPAIIEGNYWFDPDNARWLSR
ncbi:hypothetical protein [Alkalilimnicola ehrlichii]|uniref:hypothetical protein n=1 Tax=Alkalilimnicola ehrlichii TaxID=351052 RepID=UPI003B9E8E78